MPAIHPSQDASVRLALPPSRSDDVRYAPFLGRIVECKTDDEIHEVADASAALRSADLARLSRQELELLVAALTPRSSEAVRRAISERVYELSRYY